MRKFEATVTLLTVIFFLLLSAQLSPVFPQQSPFRRPSLQEQKELPAQKIKRPLIRMLPDLTASIKCPTRANPGDELSRSIKVVVKNIGPATANHFFVDLVLSSDGTVPVKLATYSPDFSEDVLLKGGRERVASLAPGASLTLPLHGTLKIPDDTSGGDYYLGVIVDAGNTVRESNERNNIALCKMRIAQALPDLIVSGFAHTGAPPGQPPECRLIVEIRNVGSGAVPMGKGRLDVYVDGVLVDRVPLDSDKVERTAYHDFHQPYDPSNPGRSRSMVSTDYIFPSSTTFENYNVRAVIDPTNEIVESDEGNNSFSRIEIIPPH